MFFFLCFIHVQWINLFFAVSPLHLLSFLQHTTPQKEQKQTNKKPRNPHQKRTPTQETKKQRNKTNCTPKTGEDAENWVPSYFCFIVLFVFLVPCFFWRAGRTKKWQDLTFCYFSQLRVCKVVFCYCLLWVCGFMTKRQNHRHVGIIVGTLWVWDMDWAILCLIQFWKYCKRLCKT